MPEMSAGTPTTTPENVADPPRCFAYKLEDETTMKNEIYISHLQHSKEYKKCKVKHTSRTLVKIMITSDVVFWATSSRDRNLQSGGYGSSEHGALSPVRVDDDSHRLGSEISKAVESN